MGVSDGHVLSSFNARASYSHIHVAVQRCAAMQALFTTVCMDAATRHNSVGIPPSEVSSLSQRCGFGVRCRPAEMPGKHQTAGSLLGMSEEYPPGL